VFCEFAFFAAETGNSFLSAKRYEIEITELQQQLAEHFWAQIDFRLVPGKLLSRRNCIFIAPARKKHISTGMCANKYLITRRQNKTPLHKCKSGAGTLA